MCESVGCPNKEYSKKTGLCRKHHDESKKVSGSKYTQPSDITQSQPLVCQVPHQHESMTQITEQACTEENTLVEDEVYAITDNHDSNDEQRSSSIPRNNRIIDLIESWEQRVKPSESKCGARNVLVFTKQSIDEVKEAFADVREIKKIGMDIEDDINVIRLYLSNAIDRLTLSRIGLNDVILHKGFKKTNTIIDIDNDDRTTKHYKKICENDDIDYEDFISLSKKDFFTRYEKITLKLESVKAINHYHDKMKQADIIESYSKIKWGSIGNLFQKTVLDICKTKPHPRNIYIVEDLGGDNGKSFLCGYINTQYDVLLVDGKPDNVYYQLSQMCDEGCDPKILILDVPRESQDYLQYNTVEKLKNGLVNSGKYESRKVNIRPPHIFIFTNFAIKTDLWTSDRIKYIDVETGEITNTNGDLEDIHGNKIKSRGY
jgi:hypothetical protein